VGYVEGYSQLLDSEGQLLDVGMISKEFLVMKRGYEMKIFMSNKIINMH